MLFHHLFSLLLLFMHVGCLQNSFLLQDREDSAQGHCWQVKHGALLLTAPSNSANHLSWAPYGFIEKKLKGKGFI